MADLIRKTFFCFWKHTVGKALISATSLVVLVSAASLAPVSSWAATPFDRNFDARFMAGDWWNWALAGPPEENPITDPDGRNCALRQQGKIWFLAGNFGGGLGEPNPVTRYCTIPTGKSLFIPLFNALWWTPEDGPTARAVRALANAQVAVPFAKVKLHLTVDGVKLNDPFAYRAQSPAGGFAFNVIPGSMADLVFGVPVGIHDPAVADGYWVLLKPMSPGPHTVHIQASSGSAFVLDVTYQLTVL
jgi:hypothetical protein